MCVCSRFRCARDTPSPILSTPPLTTHGIFALQAKARQEELERERVARAASDSLAQQCNAQVGLLTHQQAETTQQHNVQLSGASHCELCTAALAAAARKLRLLAALSLLPSKNRGASGTGRAPAVRTFARTAQPLEAGFG